MTRIGRRGSDLAASSERPPTRAWRHALAVATVAVVTYAPAMRNLHTLDDQLISSTEVDRTNAPLSTLFDDQYFSRYNQDTYRPFATLTSMVDHRLGAAPLYAGHAQNILWHACTTFLVVVLARRWLSPPAAIIAGLFFAVHPAATEATVSIGYREDSVVAFLLVAGLLLTCRRTLGSRLLASVAFALALFTKENALVFPALLVLARFTVERQGPVDKRALVRELLPFALVTAGYLAVRFGVMASPSDYADAAGGTYADTLVAVPRIFAHYLRLLVAPWPLLVLYAHMFPLGASFVSQLPWLMLDLAFLVGTVRLAPTRPALSFGLLWFAVALTPVLHFVPMRVTAADRFVHLSLVGGAIAAGALFEAARATVGPGRQRVTQSCAAVVLLALLVVTERRIPVWHDEVTLWTDTLHHNPRAYIGHFVLASKHQAQGRIANAKREFALAIADCPRDSRFGRQRFCAYFAAKLGFLLLSGNEIAAARSAFIESLGFASDFAPALVGLGFVARSQGDLEGARRYLAAATQTDPRLPVVREMIEGLRTNIERAPVAAPVTDVGGRGEPWVPSLTGE